MTVTNRAVGETINLANVLNSKLESPLLQSEMGLNSAATSTGHAVRYDEWSYKHNTDGSLKPLVDSEISGTAAIQASKLAIQKMYKKSTVANPSSTVNTYGTPIDLVPVTGFNALVPRAIDIVFGGTFPAQTISADVTVTFSDDTTVTVTKTATVAGTTNFTNTDLMTLAKDNVYIKKLSLSSKSSIASSLVTVTVNHFGYYL